MSVQGASDWTRILVYVCNCVWNANIPDVGKSHTHGPGEEAKKGKAVAQASLGEIESQLGSPHWDHRLLSPSSSLTTICIHSLSLASSTPSRI